ncbi:olfactory receptor 6B1-like [Spea bombifrons]|uniref:olfactory receptor 6B1-like n=1 Tax=Spea bombifrons TaxID=233779 RepID=UPI002349353F|nr:olfactory receptor 6B1-like [Spea bombifrons]
MEDWKNIAWSETAAIFLFCLIYIVTILSNVIIITLICQSPKLHSPMYFLIGNLSFMEIWYTSVTVPRILADILSEKKTISVAYCIAQCYFFFVLRAIENYLLGVLAYDRYQAICNPLRYTAKMNVKICYKLVFGSWISSFLGSLIPIYFLSKLTLCGSNNTINHFFCDISPLLNLSCTNASAIKLYFFTLTWLIISICLFFIIVSYLQIILTIIKISSSSGRQKAFSTCGSHLIVVVIYYASVTFIYVRPVGEHSFQFDKIVSVFYAVVTPFFNPIVYSLRNKEFQGFFNGELESSQVGLDRELIDMTLGVTIL